MSEALYDFGDEGDDTETKTENVCDTVETEKCSHKVNETAFMVKVMKVTVCDTAETENSYYIYIHNFYGGSDVLHWDWNCFCHGENKEWYICR